MKRRSGHQKEAILVVIIVILVIGVVGIFAARDSICHILRADRGLDQSDNYSYATSSSVILRTDRRIYHRDEHMIGMLVNLSSHVVEIGRKEPLIYELREFGWLPPLGVIYTMQAYPRAYEEKQIQPGDVTSIDMNFFGAKATHSSSHWSILEQQYFYDGIEYVVYSNEFVVSDFHRQSSRRTPPPDLVSAPSIQVGVVESHIVSVKNRSAKELWFNGFCSDVKVDVDYPTAYSLYTTLQRQSGEGTWQVLRPNQEQCPTVRKPIHIGRGETIELYVGDGYPAAHELDPGVYRWHVVVYVAPFPDCVVLPGCFLSGVHLFTETFER